MTKRKNTFKALINKVHLWLGLGSGILIFIICLSGTILAFEDEITRLLQPEKFYVAEGESTLGEEQLIEILQSEEGGEVAYVIVPDKADEAYIFSLKTKPEQRHGTRYYMNPYSGEILGNASSGVKEFFGFFFRLHRWLLLDSSIGRPIVGVATLIFLVMILSGIYMWWPVKLKFLKNGFKLKTSGPWIKVNYDLHNVLGFYASVLLLVLALTGLNWSFEWYRNGASALLGAEVFARGNNVEYNEDGSKDIFTTPLSITELRAMADEKFSYDGFHRINFGKGNSPVTEVRKYKSGFFAFAAPDKVWVNRNTGDILAIDDFSEKPVGAQIAGTIHDIHLANVYGGFSKLLFFIAALIGTSLPITGTLIWYNKRKLNQQKRRGAKKKLNLFQ